MQTKEKDIEDIKIIVKEAEIEDKYELVASKENDLDKNLLNICKNYSTNKTAYTKKCDSTASSLLLTILTDAELKEIHSARYRIKTIDSLLIKYIKKKALLPQNPGNDYDIEKYRPMNSNNYYKIITDLIGIRILIRYQQQWESVHNWIWTNFYKVDRKYIKNWLDDYPADDAMDFLVEKPKLYLRDMKDAPLYQKFGKDVFDIRVSDEGYSSIHYLLWYDKKYVEIQVRTIYDEAWSECTHDLVYKCKKKAKRSELERLSECLAIQTQAAEVIADLMYDKAQNRQRNTGNTNELLQSDLEDKSEKYAHLHKRIKGIKSDNKRNEFDGAIDNLIEKGF